MAIQERPAGIIVLTLTSGESEVADTPPPSGTGSLAYAAAAAAGTSGHVFGLDTDPTSVVAARGRRPSRVAWLRGDVSALPFADATLDKVITARDVDRT